MTLFCYAIAIADWPPRGKVLNRDVLTVVNKGEIHLHQNWEGKWRLAFDIQWPHGHVDETFISSNLAFQVTDSVVSLKEVGYNGAIGVSLLELSEDEQLGMKHVTHYMDVELLSRQSPHRRLAIIELYYNAPLHLAYVQRLGKEGDYPRLVGNPFFYVNPDICQRGADGLFAAWGGSE